MDHAKKNAVIAGLKELLKHLERAQQQLDMLIPFCRSEIIHLEKNDEVINAISANPVPAHKNNDVLKRKAAVDEGENSKRRKEEKEIVTQPVPISESKQECSDSENSPEDEYSDEFDSSSECDNEREYHDNSGYPKDKRCYLCRSQYHLARNCSNMNKRCYECHKWGHIEKDCTIRARRLAYENQNESTMC